MQIRKIIQRRIRRSAGGVDFMGDVNAAISGNVGESSSHSHVSSSSTVSARSVQRRKGEDSDAAERRPEQMTEEELAAANAEPLPDREAMSVIRGVHPLPQPIVGADPPTVGIEPPPAALDTEPPATAE